MKDNVNPQQQMIMKVMPVFFAVIALTLPAGLIVYFITSSLYRIAQQAYITRTFYRARPPGATTPATGRRRASRRPKPAPRPRPSPSGERPTRPGAAGPTPQAPAAGTRPTAAEGGDGATRRTDRTEPADAATTTASRPAPKKK